MQKYVCNVCGYEYDPAAGDPDSGIAPGTANKQVIFYFGADRGSDDPVKQAIDLCNDYRLVLPEPDENNWATISFLASSYRVGFGRWKDENGNPRLFVIMVGDIPGRS